MIYEVIKKFLKLSASTEKAALEIYERLPLSLRYRALYGPVFLRWLKVLKEAEGWDQERLYAFQLEQTRNLLMHAMAHVPYYKNLFRRYGYQPEKMQSFDDFRTLPFLDKEIVRDHSTALIDERLSLKYLSRKSTGGSSGIPVTIYRSRANEAAFLAFRTNILDRMPEEQRRAFQERMKGIEAEARLSPAERRARQVDRFIAQLEARRAELKKA